LIVMLVFPAAYRKLQEKVATGSARLPPSKLCAETARRSVSQTEINQASRPRLF